MDEFWFWLYEKGYVRMGYSNVPCVFNEMNEVEVNNHALVGYMIEYCIEFGIDFIITPREFNSIKYVKEYLERMLEGNQCI